MRFTRAEKRAADSRVYQLHLPRRSGPVVPNPAVGPFIYWGGVLPDFGLIAKLAIAGSSVQIHRSNSIVAIQFGRTPASTFLQKRSL